MKKNLKHFIVTVLLLFCFSFRVFSQNNLLRNPSVESDSTGAFAPVGWVSCHDWSDPDIDFEHSGIYPVHGSKLALMRSRGINYTGRHPKGSVEYMANRLYSPLLKDACYHFTVYIAYVPSASIDDSLEPNISYPLKFQLWGVNDSCGDLQSGEKLAETEYAITNENLKQFSLYFHVINDNYNYLLIKPAFDTLFRKEAYNGIILVDHMNLTKIYYSNPPSQEITFSRDLLPIRLYAADGVKWDWEPKENLSEYDIQSPFLTAYTDSFRVTITKEVGCVVYQNFYIQFACDSVEPFETITVLDTSIQYGNEVLLVPRYGEVEGNWNPQKNLFFDGKYPLAKPQESTIYSVKIFIEFNNTKCYHVELFNIKLQLEIPNVITPGDGSGLNDVFRIPGLPLESSIKIYDKNGRLVFKANPYDETNWWDGKDINGYPVRPGNYWYGLEIPGEKEPVTGYIFVVR